MKAQSYSDCESIRAAPDTLARYKTGFHGLSDFFIKKVGPVLEECNKNEGYLVTKLYMQLVIDSQGKVIIAAVIKPSLPQSCRKAIQDEFLAMDQWIPAWQDGKAVCSKLMLPVNCIKWQ